MEININDLKKNPNERKLLLNQTIDPKELYLLFQSKFQEIEGLEFSFTDENKALVFTLIYFFQKKKIFITLHYSLNTQILRLT